jgi:integrase
MSKLAFVSDNQVVDCEKRTNQLSDDNWFIKDPKTENYIQLHWNSCEGKEKHKIWAKQLLVSYLGGYSSDSGLLVCRYSTLKGFMQGMRRILIFRSRYEVPDLVSKWGLGEISSLLRESLQNKISLRETQKDANDLASRGVIDSIFCVISASKNARKKGVVSDSFTIHFKSKKAFCNSVFGDILQKHGIHITEFFRGGSFGEVRHEVVSLCVAEALDVLNSDKTKLARALCCFQQSEYAVNHSLIYGYKDREKSGNRVSLNAFIENGQRFKHAKKPHPARENARQRLTKLYKKLSDSVGYPLTKPIWKSHSNFTEYCIEIYDACVILFLALTGVRASELSSIRVNDYFVDECGDWVFRSEISKTHSGAYQVRVMHGVLAEAANVLTDLSYSNKRIDSVGLFQRNICQHTIERDRLGRYVGFKPNTASLSVKRFYERFQAKHGAAVTSIQPSISPHQFRHSFVGFAIRRFDGSVLEPLRKHFMHSSYKDYMSFYTRGKLSQNVIHHYEREYIRELIERIATSKNQYEFSGKIVPYIKKRIDEIIRQRVKVLTPEALAELIDEINGQVISICVNEFGYCFLTELEAENARCINPKTNIPDPKQLSGFVVCSGCPNRLSECAHKEAIVRKAIAHQDFLDKYPLKVKNKAIKASQNAVKNAEIIVSELGG